jgi:catechol 2,3-dioxygenase-like lactoylglutathione lyase family enzyme
MIGYVTLGTNNFPDSVAFYDALFGSINAGRVFEMETFIAWGPGPSAPAVAVTLPYNKEAATPGNGTMVAIAMKTSEQVDQFYARALELGASDEGAPGQRINNFYAGYFRDPDGNKLNAFCMLRETI